MPLVTSGAAHVISTVVTSIIVLVTFCTGSGGGNNGVPVGATLAVPDVEVTVPADVEVGIIMSPSQRTPASSE